MNQTKFLKGTIKRHPDGFGFFIPQDPEHPDVFIPAHSMKTAMTNDLVTVLPEKERDGRYRGDIIRIEKRAQSKIAGAFFPLNEKYGLIKDEGKGWGQDLKVVLAKSIKAEKGELVVAQITSYPDEGQFEGEIIEIIGDIEDALNDIKRVVIAQNIPEEFSEKTLSEAKKFTDHPTEKDFQNRKDLRDLDLITIDGATAKDFDDAVFVEMTSQGFRLIVAIADVSHYVKLGTSMNEDAYERGTSVYFPNFVIPMLPEALSNGLCSLNPHVPRLALVADMQFDFTGATIDSQFYEAVIESKARVTYGQAQEIIDSPEGSTEIHQKFNHVKEVILRCSDLAKILMAKRFKEGSLDLEVPETELIIDGSGEPVDVIKSERLFAHRLIEEMMLAANVAVAKFLSEKEIPSLYRTHESPDPLKIKMLEKYIHNFGSKANLSGDKLQKKLTRALQDFAHQPQGQIIHILTLRSMSQAKYTLENIGHFGLGFDFYTHFTSPIRRYPDLIVHRLLKHALGIKQYSLMQEADVQTAGTWLSACEQRSAKAERQIHAIKKARFMKKLVGQTFEGMISSVTKFGVFVLLREYNIDGLVAILDLSRERLEFDEENLKLVAPRSGQAFSLGDHLKVQISSIDIEQGQINFILEGAEKSLNKVKIKDLKSKDRYSKKDKFSEKNKYSDKEKSSKKDKKVFVSDFKSSKKTRADGDFISRGKQHSENKKNESYQKEDKFKQDDHIKIDPSKSQVIKPKYASLSDYLDKMKTKKGSNSDESNSNKQQKTEFTQSKNKSRSSVSENKSNSKKRESSSSDSRSSSQARSKKSSRKNKSR